MLSAIGIGKTIEKAIESALFELKAPREDVDIKILSEGGLFKKAKVEVTISEDAKEKYVKKAEPKKELKKEISKLTKVEAAEPKAEVKPQEPINEVKEEVKTKQEKVDKVVEPLEFLEGYFKVLGKTVEITTVEDDKFITYNVAGDDLGECIGRHGEAYYALTKLLQTLAGKREKRILLDIDGYKEKREESLSETAKRLADKVAKSGRYMKLEPMKASERRVIHTALQDDERVTTLSKGTEPRRYVIIFPKEYKEHK